ncbi:hypothetical protein [Opitutus terrae]|uniref:Uncharacterized protein n=1 Tax=Opitutus terrae (strain DSM 11246 / JCM 15787 / PB90-1) TaxID=452637 RepID=B1ZYQ0_OPITP|nr:hypothetical protein [Opitutus terrae]ACB75286.1 hypothetical protein Oter_2003 [Opitutus terrae PB90-1]
MSFESPPPPDSTLLRQRRVLQIAIVVLIVGAIAIAGFVPRIPLPVRLFVAATDLIAAAVLWLVLRQKFRL